MNVLTFLANAVLLGSSLRRYRHWRSATVKVAETQRKTLLRIVNRNSSTKFGQEHRFNEVKSVDDYQRLVPLRKYADFTFYIELIAAGERDILSVDPITTLELSSGSTSASKLIPYSLALASEFQQGIDPWLYSLYTSYPKLLTGKQYWSITPIAKEQSYSPGGIPIGFEDDAEYFGPLKRKFVQALMAVPSAVCRITDTETFRYVTLRFLLQCRDLTFISVWNPTFLSLLLGGVRDQIPTLLADIETGSLTLPSAFDSKLRSALGVPNADADRAAELKDFFEKSKDNKHWRSATGRSLYEAIWPKLTLISCWADASAAEYAKRLQELFPNTALQPKGLLATEGFVTFPFGSKSEAALSVNSHFYEFAELDSGEIRLAHQLELGHSYSVIMTTGGGLYRYELNDMVEVTGFIDRCPTLRFLGKAEAVVDIFGEKLNEYHVQEVVSEQLARHSLKPTFWMLAPEQINEQSGRYTLFMQPQKELPKEVLTRLSLAVEEKLQENYHYRYCRKLGQLQPLQTFLIQSETGDATELYIKTCESLGQRLGNIKPTYLHSYLGWATVFSGLHQ